MRKFTVITKDGSKWLRPVNPNEKYLIDEFGRYRNPDHRLFSRDNPDLLYLGDHPEGTVLSEEQVTLVYQVGFHDGRWVEVTYERYVDEGDDGFPVRIAYTDIESHELSAFDEILNNTSDDAKMNVSLQMDLNYWKRRCEAAENYINESPCDPDITKTQNAAYEAWQEIVKQQPK